jgi:hypothetical protein
MDDAAARWQARDCRLCGTTLGALQRLRGDVCQRLTCRRLAANEQALRQRDATLAARRAQAARRWQAPEVAAVPVLWLTHHETRLVPLPAATRQAQQKHLARLAAEVSATKAPSDTAVPTPPETSTPLAAPLCTFCAGRCCRYGASSHAFITTELLRRWLVRHPGSSAEDAAAAYLARLPRQHVEASCVHHGRQGCTLPAEMRSDICNRYACDTLRAVQDAGTAPALLVAMQREARLGDVALLHAEGPRRLPRRLPRR